MMEQLNEQQLAAVTTNGNTLILAGAGTGKTRVITNRIIYLINQGVAPESIYAFTFTNKAADEMKLRLKKYQDQAQLVNVMTFHKFCFMHLKEHPGYIDYPKGFVIIDNACKLKMLKEIINEKNLPISDKLASKLISNIKNHTYYPFESIKQAMLVNYIFIQYQAKLKQYGRLDLDDLLFQFLKLLDNYLALKEFIQESCQYLLVDEAQDLNCIQFDIIKVISRFLYNIYIVGDIDQCIYTFRGSDINIINQFIKDYRPTIIKLETNYRSNQNILDVANMTIKDNHNRIDKYLYASNLHPNHQVIYAELESSDHEAIYIAKLIIKLLAIGYKQNEIAVLYRNNSISIHIEKELTRQKIPYRLVAGNSFFDHKEIKTLSNYYYFLSNNDDDIALSQIYAYPPRKIGESTFNDLKRIAKQNNISIFDQMKQSNNPHIQNFVVMIADLELKKDILCPSDFIDYLMEVTNYQKYLSGNENGKKALNRILVFIQMIQDLECSDGFFQATLNFINQTVFREEDTQHEEKIELMTIHQSKGLEFKVVIVAGCNEGIMPSNKSDFYGIEEERRIFYVAITRAKERLYLISATNRIINGVASRLKPSSFLTNIIDLMNFDSFKNK